MSLAFLTKPIGGKKDAESNGESSKQNKPGRGSGSSRGDASAVVGGSPRVDLMPVEIRVKRAQLKTRRSLRLGLVAVLLLVVAACGGTWAWSGLAQTSLTNAQSEHQALILQAAKYSNVTTIKESIALIKAGQVVGDSTEIDWKDYLTKLQATLPSGVTITTVAVDSATPMKPYAQTTTPLQGDRIATLTFSATSATLPSVPVWLDGLKTLPGFVDATPGSVTLSDAGYVVDVDMHINSDALANRFGSKSATTTGGN